MSYPERLPGDAYLPLHTSDARIDRHFDRDDYDDHDGWNRGRCPRCKRLVWAESGCVFECPCGYTEVEDEESDE